MEVVATDSHEFSLRLCSDGCDEQSLKSSDPGPCGISVHKSRPVLSVDNGIVEKQDLCIADTQEHFTASVTSQQSVITENELLAVDRGVFPFALPTVADVSYNCTAEDSQSACTNALLVNAVTSELANCDISVSDHAVESTEPQSVSRPKSLCSGKKSVCFPVDDVDSSADQTVAVDGKCVATLESKRVSLLLRLFESKLFDMAIALPYLFNSKELGVLAYLG